MTDSSALSPSQEEAYEIRMAELDNGRKVLDEVCASGANVHFESMDEDHLWCGIYLPDGRALMVNIWAVKRGRLCWRVSEDWAGGKEYADAE